MQRILRTEKCDFLVWYMVHTQVVRMQRMCYYVRTDSCRPEFGSLYLKVERTGWFGSVCIARECGAVGAVGSPGTGSASLSKQVCRSQEWATLAALCGEVCAVVASAGWSSHYLSALCEPSQWLFNLTPLPAPPTGEVWPAGDMRCRSGMAS